MSSPVLDSWNGHAVAARDVPVLPVDRFQEIVRTTLRAGGRLSSLFGLEAAGKVLVTAVLADDR